MKNPVQPRHTHCVREGCGKQRRRPKGKWAIDAWLADGFCSTECAKMHFGVQVPATSSAVEEERESDLSLAEALA